MVAILEVDIILLVGVSGICCYIYPLSLIFTYAFLLLFHSAYFRLLLCFSCIPFAVIFIGSTLFALQQLSGINAVFYFSSTVFKSAGVPSNLANGFIGIANLIGITLIHINPVSCQDGCSLSVDFRILIVFRVNFCNGFDG